MGEAGGQLTPEMQEFIMREQMRAQVQQTVARVTDVCWEKCLGTPGRSLSSREEACLSECARRFIEATQLVVQRFQQQGGQGGF